MTERCIRSLAPDAFDLGIVRIAHVEGDPDSIFVGFRCGCIAEMVRRSGGGPWTFRPLAVRYCGRLHLD
jgi:hypothetical protein